MSLVEQLKAMTMSAVISEDGRFRYELRRTWDATKPVLVVVMLNPSTADAEKNDPTLFRVMHFAIEWGYGGVVVINLFSLRSPQPRVLIRTVERDGPEHLMHWERALDIADETKHCVLAAWGNDGILFGRGDEFIHQCRRRSIPLVCLGKTSSGNPKHPLARGYSRVPNDQRPVPFRTWGGEHVES